MKGTLCWEFQAASVIFVMFQIEGCFVHRVTWRSPPVGNCRERKGSFLSTIGSHPQVQLTPEKVNIGIKILIKVRIAEKNPFLMADIDERKEE